MQVILSPSPQLTDIRADLEKVYEVSAYLDFPFTLDEVADYFLASHNLTSEELASLISEGKFPSIPFQIKDRYLLSRPSQSESSRLEREQISAEKLGSAGEFSSLLKRLVPFVRTVAVTGSVAYGSAGKWDDIDLFVVTQRNRLWVSVLMTLILVRLKKALGLGPANLLPFCLSYVHDEKGFEDESLRNRANPLFARELIKAKPVAGTGVYRRMLEQNDWVRKMYEAPYFAALKDLKVKSTEKAVLEGSADRRLSLLFDWADGIVYVFLSRYLKLRAYLTNLKLRSSRQDLRIFEPRISRNSCVYTSNFYRWLSSMWGQK